MPTLSIVIVNYNVRHFLTNCLDSIEKSKKMGFQVETIVVDNASIDGSISAIHASFPEVILIENKTNVGFGKANNQGFSVASGQYILALNPDTILQEDTLSRCWQFMESNRDCGVLGVKMVDGSGTYLPESKRGRPGLWNAFCKFSGLTALFPKSKWMSGYYLGHLDEDQLQEVDVLCGAFMFFRSEALLPCKGFDEDFFMYGEDIDLSVRIKKAGWKVVYLPDTRIIHFKGESSKKASFNYIKHFYQSMSIYVGKHYTGWYGGAFRLLIRLAIWLTAGISFIKHNVLGNFLLILDFALTFAIQSALKKSWAVFYFDDPDYYDNLASQLHTLGTSFTWIFFLWFFGHYDLNWKPRRQWTGLFFGTVGILIVYSLLPSEWRSSRFLIIAGALITVFATLLTRKLSVWVLKNWLQKGRRQNYLIVALSENAKKIRETLQHNEPEANVIGFLYPQNTLPTESKDYLNTIQNIGQVVDLYKADNIVFSTDDMPMQRILDLMVQPDKEVRYLITGSEDTAVVSSNSSTRQGKFYHAASSFRLSQGLYIRLKRAVDVGTAFFVLLLFPMIAMMGPKKRNIFNAAWRVLKGKATWVGYLPPVAEAVNNEILPPLKPSIWTLEHLKNNLDYLPMVTDEYALNQYYAKNYSPVMDLSILYHKIFVS
ncbi:MAG TPA: glycosyltransferase [Saprospiraceae bacterium]|nr:glycosyltransferase [Saprospiraceae bacterium]